MWQCLTFDNQQRPDYVGFFQAVQTIKVRQKLYNNQALVLKLTNLQSTLEQTEDYSAQIEVLNKITGIYADVEDYQNQLKYK